MASDDIKLAPCPFCGCALDAEWNRPNPKARCRTEGCKGRQLPVLNLDVPDDIVAWNTRAGASHRQIGEILLDAKGHPFARLRTGYDEHGEQWKEGTAIYAGASTALASGFPFHTCGGPLSRNPHHDAGKPGHTLTEGCVYECIPCTVKSRHEWAQRALKAETALRDQSSGQAPAAGAEPVALEMAWRAGWAACRDAEYAGQEAENEAWGNSHTHRLVNNIKDAPVAAQAPQNLGRLTLEEARLWRVVPVEPTAGMLVAGNHGQPGDFSAAKCWSDMLEAADRSTELRYLRPRLEGTKAPTPPASAAPARQQLRELVDLVWNEATESTAVPETPWADRLIDRVFGSAAPSPQGDARDREDAERYRTLKQMLPQLLALAAQGGINTDDAPQIFASFTDVDKLDAAIAAARTPAKGGE